MHKLCEKVLRCQKDLGVLVDPKPINEISFLGLQKEPVGWWLHKEAFRPPVDQTTEGVMAA